ncbi:MAG: hypothetical protein ABIK89_22135, partial [Planctomycetota bacterium]
AGSHSVKMGGDFRLLGDKSASYGASTGSYNFSGTYSTVRDPGIPSNAGSAADMLLGYFTRASVPLNDKLHGFLKYYSGYVQDDWRVSNKFTINYGIRLERETGLIEENNRFSVDFDKTAVSPLNSQVNLIDPVTGARRQILGGLVYAGVNGAATEQGNLPDVTVAPRVGLVYSIDDNTVVRGGWGLFYAPYNYGAAGTTSWGQIGYSATTQTTNPAGTPVYRLSDPFPNGLTQPTRNSLGLLTGTGADITLVDPTHGQPRVQQYSVDFQRALPGAVNLSLGYTGLKSDNMSWGSSVNINQLDPKYQSLLASTSTKVPNPFLGIADAGQFANSSTLSVGQLLRPFPQFDDVTMSHVMGAHSLYHAAIFQVNKRSTTWWGGRFSYTWSRLTDNQFGGGNYYSSAPGLMNVYQILPDSSYYDPEGDYGRSLMDSPHKIVIAPSFSLPFGQGRTFLSDSRIGDILLGGWTLTPVVTFSSGFPMGVSQQVSTSYNFLMGGSTRPNIVPGVDFLLPGDITDRIRENLKDNIWYNKEAFSLSPVNTFGNSGRRLPGVLSPWRNNVNLSIGKSFRTGGRTNASLRAEILNVFNQVVWAAPSSTFGSSSFGQVNNQANNMRMVQFSLRFQF